MVVKHGDLRWYKVKKHLKQIQANLANLKYIFRDLLVEGLHQLGWQTKETIFSGQVVTVFLAFQTMP